MNTKDDEVIQQQSCRYQCGEIIIFKGKTKEKGSTGWFETNNLTIEHTYKRCYDIRISKGLYTPKGNVLHLDNK